MDFTDSIEELINRRRRQILVHSCIYYQFNTSIIPDKQFDAWAYELAALQRTYPDIANKCAYAQEFADFDGTTGFHLPMYGWIVDKAQNLINIHREMQKNGC
jgi:NAD-dependent DNA ligase